jgi:hypothetical protein
VGLGVIGGSVQSQIKTQVKPKPGEIILYDGKGYRRYRPYTSAIIEVVAKTGIKVEHFDFDFSGFAFFVNRVEIEVSKRLLSVKFMHDCETEDKIVLYNADKSKVVDTVLAVDGFVDIFTQKHMAHITMYLPHAVMDGYGVNIRIERIKSYKNLSLLPMVQRVKVRRI